VVDGGKITNFNSTDWHQLKMTIDDAHVVSQVDGAILSKINTNFDRFQGWAAIGSSWNYVQFDNFGLDQTN
jgi:hypothetical protein